MKQTIPVLFLVILVAACTRKPDFPVEPEITAANVSKSLVVSGVDSLVVSIDFRDGDGDIGLKNNESDVNAYLIDSRTGFALTYKIPYISSADNPQAISATVWFTIHPFSLNCRPTYTTFDTVSYEIYIVDRAGHESNRMSTPEVVIQCQ